MRQLSQIVLTTEEANFAERLSKVLHSNHSVSVLNTCRGIGELRTFLAGSKTPVAIVDIDSNPQKMLHELDTLSTLFPSTRFVAASSESSREVMLEAMLAGVRHFMDKKSIESDLDRVLERLLMEGTRINTDLGTIITVLSAGGGSGATTISLNLANELRLKSSKQVLVIDLDNCYGAVSSYLGVNGYSIYDVLSKKGRIDRELIATSATNYKENFDVLVSSAGINLTGSNGHYDNLSEALEACRQVYKYVIIDAPRMTAQATKILSEISKAILVVFQSNVKDIKIAKNMIASLKDFNVSNERIFPVVNRLRQWLPPVPFKELKKAVETPELYRVRNDYKKIIRCINHGQPLSELAPRSGIRRDFQKMAANIYGLQNGNNSGNKQG